MKNGLAQMKKCSSFLILISSVLISQVVFAADKIYRCQVLSDAYIQSDGEISLVQDSPRLNQEFTIIKKTGQVYGGVMDALNNPKIITSGNAGNSYKVIWVQKSANKNGVYVDYLSIEGSAKEGKKPFGFFSGSLVMTGVCE